ncbi:MAG: hypothetical protein WBE92_13280, partial [Steroidobacteraceae bacterium]
MRNISRASIGHEASREAERQLSSDTLARDAPEAELMTSRIPAARLRLIERIVSAARQLARSERIAPRSGIPRLAESFLRAYYHGVAGEDLAARDPRYLAAAALAHWRLGRVRPRQRPLVRVLSPGAGREGSMSPHTQVLVVTNDMPFLVDSLGIVFSEAAIGVHLIVHPVLSVERDRKGELTGAGLVEPATRAGTAVRAGRRRAESWQFFEIDLQLDPERLIELERRLLATLADVRAAVADWEAMRKCARSIA